MVEIALPEHLVPRYGERILQAAPGAVRLLPALGGAPGDPDLSGAVIALNADFEGPVPFRALIDGMPALRWIHTASSGIDDFASPALVERGILVTNSAGLFSPSIAEYVLAAMTGLARGMPTWQRLQAERRWGDPAAAAHPPVELLGRRAGIVGYGAIGRYVARLCRALGMEVWATKRVLIPTVGEPLDRLLPGDRLHELLAASDVVVLAASLNAASRGLIGARELAAMRPDAMLINVARGALIDEDALVDALEAGHLRGAALDVASVEPLPAESRLWDAPRLVLTPHIASAADAGWDRSIQLFCDNLRLFLDGRTDAMANLVDPSLHL